MWRAAPWSDPPIMLNDTCDVTRPSSTENVVRREWSRLRRVMAGLDKQATVVLLMAALVVILQMQLGSRSWFRSELAPLLDITAVGLWSWGWWFAMQGLLGFVLPILVLKVGFGRSWADMGLSRGDTGFAWMIAGLYLPLVLVGTWFLSDGDAFKAQYPHYSPAALDWRIFAIYEGLFLFYWFGWEYLWRGFVLFGTRHVFGVYAIIIQTLPFAILHYDKPMPEALLSIVGGLAIGALVWRARAFWIAVPIHAAQMLILDTWCTLRIRSGAEGFGLNALWVALTGW